MTRATNILIASVGGQGGLTLARVLASAAVIESLHVRTGETLGMAQRYGSVVSYVRVGWGILSPIFGPSEADYLLGLELCETHRNIHYLKPGGKLIVADEYRPPYLLSLGNPGNTRDNLVYELKTLVPDAIVVPARKVATEVGNPRALNMVVLGVFMGISSILKESSIEAAIATVLPRRAVDSSIAAFRQGLKLCH